MANPTPAARQTSKAVEAAMIAAGRSMNGLADATGIPYSTLRRKLQGHADFTLGELLMIAEALNVNPATLLPAAFKAVA